jgi:hypothetical protein
VSDAPDDRGARRAEALGRLPVVYARALWLRDRGLPEEVIARRLAVEPAALDALFELAEAKLATILEAESGQ